MPNDRDLVEAQKRMEEAQASLAREKQLFNEAQEREEKAGRRADAPKCCSVVLEAFLGGRYDHNSGEYCPVIERDEEGRVKLTGTDFGEANPIRFCPWCGKAVEVPDARSS